MTASDIFLMGCGVGIIGYVVFNSLRAIISNAVEKYNNAKMQRDWRKYFVCKPVVSHDDLINFIGGYGLNAVEIRTDEFTIKIKVTSKFWKWKTKRVLAKLRKDILHVVPVYTKAEIEVVE